MKRETLFPLVLLSALVVSCCAYGSDSREPWKDFAYQDQPRPEDEIVPGPNIWIEGLFIEVQGHAISKIESDAGFQLSPPDGKVILNADEKRSLLEAVRMNAAARVIGSASLLTVTRRSAQTEIIDEVTFRAVSEDEEENNIKPAEFTAMDTGVIFNVTARILEDGRIALIMMPEVSPVTQWQVVPGTDMPQPVRRSWSRVSTAIVPDGSTIVLKDSLIEPPLRPHGPDAEPRVPETVQQAVEEQLDTIVPEVNFEEEKLEEVVRWLSKETNANIVIDPAVFTGYRHSLSMFETTTGLPGETMTPGPTPPPEDLPGAGETIVGPTGEVLVPGGRGVGPGIAASGTAPGSAERPEPTWVTFTQEQGITVKLRNVPFRVVLKAVLSQKGLDFYVSDYMIMIVPAGYVPVGDRSPGRRTLLTIISAKIVEPK